MVDSLAKRLIIRNGGGVGLLLCLVTIQSFGQAMLNVDTARDSRNYGRFSIQLPAADYADSFISLDKEAWTAFFRVTVDGSERAMFGDYWHDQNTLHFAPRYLPDPMVVYRVLFSATVLTRYIQDRGIKGELDSLIRFQPKKLEASMVTRIYPSVSELPSNVLRFYIYFSKPMSFADPYNYLSILDDEGNKIEDAFVEVSEGLWNEDRTRLTVLIHPGRIKRGVGPRQMIGPVFQSGRNYQLIVSDKWKDANGLLLTSSFVKEIAISSPVREKISLADWKLKVPQRLTRERIPIQTVSLLDEALISRMVAILHADGEKVSGRFEFDSSTKQLFFTPERPWKSGPYELEVKSILEDICGNTLMSAFDAAAQPSIQTAGVSKIEFLIK